MSRSRSVYEWWSRHPRLLDLFYDLVFLGRERQFRGQAVDALELSPGDTVLELGAGNGNGLAALREGVGADGRVVALELSQGMTRRAAARIEERGWENVEVVRADATRPPVRDGSVDAVYAAMSLSAMPDPAGACAAAHAALRPGGRLAVLDAQPFQTAPLTLLNAVLNPLFRATTDWVPEACIPDVLERLFEDVSLSTYTDGTLFVAGARKGAKEAVASADDAAMGDGAIGDDVAGGEGVSSE